MDNTLKKEFDTNGFIKPFQVYKEEEAKKILRSIRRDNFNRSNAIFNNDVNYDRHFDIQALGSHIFNKKIIEKLRILLGNDILCWRTEFFPKFPGSNGTEWHQVANYQYANGKPMLLEHENKNSRYMDLTVWTAFTDATKETGCMKFIPGSHLKKYYDESKAVNNGRDKQYNSLDNDTGFYGYDFSEFKVDKSWNPEEEDITYLEMKAGECVIFTAKCVHGSCGNSSENKTRFAISSRYVPTHVRVYPDQKQFFSHGSLFSLDKYGCVLVSGEDVYGHNKIKSV